MSLQLWHLVGDQRVISPNLCTILWPWPDSKLHQKINIMIFIYIDPEIFWPDPVRFFLTRREMFGIFGCNFLDPSQPVQQKMTEPRWKTFDLDPLLYPSISVTIKKKICKVNWRCFNCNWGKKCMKLAAKVNMIKFDFAILNGCVWLAQSENEMWPCNFAFALYFDCKIIQWS